MADDLDDFFAKKDKKKKSKGKPTYISPDELAKNLEDTTKLKHEAAAKSKKLEQIASAAAAAAATIGSGDESKIIAQEQRKAEKDEEWKEFEEEQRKDYTGLKIGQLNLDEEDSQSPADLDDEDGGDGDNILYDEDGTRIGEDPWKKVIPAEEVTQIPMEIEKPSKVYISPALRHSQGMMPGTRLKTRNRAAPDITNADYFPTLGAARPEEQRKKKNEPAFEEVRHGGRLQRVPEKTAAPVAVTNRFQSLDEDAS